MRDIRIVAGILDDPGPARSPVRVSLVARLKAGRAPPGSAMVTGSGNAPVCRASKAARTAAVAQAPVVQPRRRGSVAGAS